MREEESSNNWNWLPSKWEEDELPPPEDLMPLSQSLITPHLALAFNIPTSSPEFDSPDLSAAAAADEPARTLKRPRLVWTPQLHKRFVDAVAHLGIKNAVPKTIMQLMSVDGLTRENVASHLQKYRLYLKRMQSVSAGGGGGGGGSGDAATDRLFASQPVPAHFLHPGRGGSDCFMPPFVPPPAPHHQMAVVHHQQQEFRGFGNLAASNGQFENPFLRQSQQVRSAYVEDLETANGRKVLTLFPTGE